MPLSISLSTPLPLRPQSHLFLLHKDPTLIPIPQTNRKNHLKYPKLCSVAARQIDYELASSRANSRPPSLAKVFVGYTIYKGKAALTVEPRAPEFVPLDSGAYKVGKEGFMILQFAPSLGPRQYDWTRKQVFSLSVGEMGTLMSLGGKEACEFFHDPFMGRSDEGKVRKVLRVEPLPDNTGYFFNLSVQNRLVNLDESIYVPITKAEFTILNSTFSYILPYLLGWNAFADSIRAEDSTRSLSNSRSGAELEWGR